MVAQCIGLALVHHQHAGGDAGAVEQARRQADDGLDDVVVDQVFADEFFLAAAEQHAVGHDGRHVAVGLEAGDHVLHEHEVGLLAGFRAEFAEAAGELHGGAAVVLRERRVGEHAIEFARLTVFQDQRVLQRIPVLDGEAGDVVEDHVHVADGPDRAVRVLPIERKVVGILPLLLDVLVGLDQKTARAGRGVVDGVAGLGLGELHQQAHDLGGGVELAAFLAGAVCEKLDQILVSGAQQVGELEVVVDQHELRLVEVIEQILPLLIRDLGLALDGIEVDVVLQHPGQGVVFVLDGGDSLVEHGPDVVLEVLERRDLVALLVDPALVPAGARRHEEGVPVGGLVIEQLVQQRGLVLQVGIGGGAQDGPLAVELVRQALDEQHAEDEFLELAGVHLAAQDVGGLEEEALQLGEGDLVLLHVRITPLCPRRASPPH